MSALENAVLALNDAEVFTEYLMNLGERHLPWTLKMEHFDVCILRLWARIHELFKTVLGKESAHLPC